MNIRRLLLLLLLSAVPTRAQLPIPPVSFSTGGNITAANAACNVNNCVLISLPSTAAVLTVGVTNTYSATLKPEESQDNGRTWTSAGADITGTGTTSYVVAGFSNFRVRGNAYTSGNAGVNMLASVAPSGGVTSGTTDPTGLPCAPNSLYVRTTNGFIYSCSGGTFTLSGGGGGTLTGTGTAGFLSKWTAGTALGNSLCDEVTTANTDTCSGSGGIAVPNGPVSTGANPCPGLTAGTGGVDCMGEGTAPTSPAGLDTIYGNAANHCASLFNNGTDTGCVASANGGSNALGLKGATSGVFTITAPAIAGVSTNGAVISNVLLGPSGAAGTPTYSFSSHSDAGLYYGANGVYLSHAGVPILRGIQSGNPFFGMSSTGVFYFTSGNIDASGDTAISRVSAGVLAVGNSTQGDASASLIAANLFNKKYTNTLTAQVAAITDTTMVTVGGTSTAYRFTGTLNCTTTSAAATASLNLKWTDTSSTAQTLTVTITCTALGASSIADMVHAIRAKNATAITFGVSIVNTPTFDIDVRLELM